MKSKLLIQQCLMVMAVATAMEFGIEFGRVASLDKDAKDNEVRIRELLDEDLLFFSMSMSLSMSLDYNPEILPAPTATPNSPESAAPMTPEIVDNDAVAPPPSTPVPATSPPTESPVTDTAAASQCEDDGQTVSVSLEVDTAIGKDDFAADVENAIRTAIGEIYSFCEARRLAGRSLEDGLDDNLTLGSVAVVELAEESCTPQATNANACHSARVDFDVYGDTTDNATEDIQDSLMVVFSDLDFDNGLLMKGIIDVRVADTNVETAIKAPLSAGDNDVSPNGRSKLAAILSAAGGTLLLVLIVSKLKRRSNSGNKYDTDSDSQEGDDSMVNTAV